ncbi:MAG TPA: SpoIIE family protein phosphatase [Acidobacteriaceae bacterium]|jgi:sigma-B regulation protein RsbU (phosphoserine phosphatase)|nr:SpoIIE family protein phosphatase [Acidobacteriaceae bacterium]
MKRRKKQSASPGLLRFFIGLWILASLTYWMAGVVDLWQDEVHWDQRVDIPFQYGSDSRRIEKGGLQPEAKTAGLVAGDRIQQLNGADYTGTAQWDTILSESHPGDILDVGFTRPNGSTGTATLTLVRDEALHGRISPVLGFWRDFFLVGLLTLVCLLIGYWVVFTRPADRNAWLLLVLLTFPSCVLITSGLATGIGLFLREFWYQTIQLAGAPALLLFGVYFPERSRIDMKARWAKWGLLGVFGVCLAILYPAVYMDYYGGGDGPMLTRASEAASAVVNFLNLLWVGLFLVLTLDKQRSASTQDARRRLRVLLTGMSVGVGSLLLVFVLLPHFGANSSGDQPRWYVVRYLGAVIFMLAPLTLAYVVVVQRAMDVRVLLRTGSRYALARASLWVFQIVLLVVIGIRLFLPMIERRQPQASDVWAAVIFLGLILALRFGVSNRLQQWLDRRFFREAYNAEVMLNELSDEVRRFTETQPLLETVAKRICETLHIRQIAMLLRRGDSFYVEEAVGMAADGSLTLPAQASSIRYLANSSEPARLYREDPDAWYLMAGTAERRALDGLNAELLLPLPGRNRLMGVMALGPKRSEAAWSRTDLAVLTTVARQTGLALEVSELAHSLAAEAAQRERVNREIEIAREVQERLFPQLMPQLTGASVAGACRAALGVGGDYYDVIQLEDGRTGLAVGDVSGKGISAALLMASLRASLRGVALDNPRDFAKLMHKVNLLVYEASASNRYATFFFAAYDPETRKLDCVNAGHNPPVLLRRGQVIRLEADGPVVGLLPFAPYTEQSLTLEPGDLLVLYTDGISEAMTHEDEEWGEERMIEAALKVRNESADAVLRAVFTAADAFTAGAPQHDDMTLLVLKLEDAARGVVRVDEGLTAEA